MQGCNLHIVGLPYYEVGECLGEFFAEAVGRGMTLRPEPTNDFDANAICAYDWQGRHVGYVAGHDLLRAWRAFRGSGRRSLRGRIVEKAEDHKCVVFECQVEALAEEVELYPAGPFLNWKYSGPVLKPTKEMVRLEYMMDEVTERLDEYEHWSETERDDFMLLARRFCNLSKYDLSGDMDSYRRRLYLQLLSLKDKGFIALTEDLRMAFGRTGRESHGGDVLSYWTDVLSIRGMVRSLLVVRREYDINKVREQLEAFPESMFQVWLENRERFVSKLFYLHVPRHVLWQFVSGIAFYEALRSRDEQAPAEPPLDEGRAAEAESPVYLSAARGQKIDIIRVLDVLYEQGKFHGKDGLKLTKKEYFEAMGRAIHVNLSDYDKDLSRSLSDSTAMEKHLKVFEEMRQKMIEIFNSK